MSCVLFLIRSKKQLKPHQELSHDLNPQNYVLVKKYVRKSCLEPRWPEPFQVLLVTNTAFKCQGLPNWIHASHTKRVPVPIVEEEDPVATENHAQESPESPSTAEEVLYVP